MPADEQHRPASSSSDGRHMHVTTARTPSRRLLPQELVALTLAGETLPPEEAPCSPARSPSESSTATPVSPAPRSSTSSGDASACSSDESRHSDDITVLLQPARYVVAAKPHTASIPAHVSGKTLFNIRSSPSTTFGLRATPSTTMGLRATASTWGLRALVNTVPRLRVQIVTFNMNSKVLRSPPDGLILNRGTAWLK